MKKFDLVKSSDDFDFLYLLTLYFLIEQNGKNRLVVKLFELPEVIDGFKKEMYENNNWSFPLAFDSNLHTNPKFRKLKNLEIDVLRELNDFKNEFKRFTSESRKPKEVTQTNEILASIKNLSESIETLPAKFGRQIQIIQKFTVNTEPNSIVENYSLRVESRTDIETDVKVKNWVSLHGGVSTGKTQLAALIYNSWEKERLWISLRGGFEETDFYLGILYALVQKTKHQADLILDLTRNIEILLEKLDPDTLLVLDDLPKLTGRAKSDEFIVLLNNQAIKRRIRILTTSNYEVPSAISELIPTANFISRPVPFMTKSETEEVLFSYSKDKDKADGLKTFVFNMSSGHPTIVSAICKYLSSKNWQLNDSEFNILFGGDYSHELTENTFDYLTKTIQDEKTRELLFRLNLIIGNFSDNDISQVCEVEPAISEPFIKIHSMMGLWVQRTSPSLYELSPLIKRLKIKNLNSITERKIFAALGETILAKKKLDQLDANRAIIYFISAKEFNRAGFVYTLVLNEAQENPEIYFDSGFLIYWNKTPLPQEMDFNLRLYIRFIQTKLHNDTSRDTVYLLGDLEALVSEGQAKGVDITFAALWLSALYSKSNPSKSSKYFTIGYGGIELIKDLSHKQSVATSFVPEEMIWMAAFGIKSRPEFDTWFAAFKNLTSEQRKNSMVSQAMDITCSMIFHNFIRLEESKEEGNWKNVIADFEYIQTEASDLDLELLAVSAVRFRVTVLSEKLKQISEARILADEYLSKGSISKLSVFLIKDAIGRQLFYNGKADDSYSYISDAVEIPTKEIYIEKLESYLAMSQLLGRRNQEKAHIYSKKAYDFVVESKFVSETQRVKVIGEYSISLFLNGDLVGAIIAIEEGFSILMDSYSTSHQHKTIVLRYGHALNYFRHLLTKGIPPEKDINGEPYAIPQRGMLTATFNPTAVDKYYFDERPFMTCYLLMDCAQEIGDFALSKKWALKCLNLNNATNIFYEVIHQCLFYLIDDNKFDETFYWSIEIVKKMNGRKESDYDKLSSYYAFKESNRARPVVNIDRYDDILMENVVQYLVIKVLKDSLEHPESRVIRVEQLIAVLVKWVEVFKDKDSILEVIELLRLYSKGPNLEALLQRVQIYQGSLNRPVRLIGYLILAMDSVTIEALKLHSAMIERLDTYAPIITPGGHIYLVIPFFEKFWFNRHQNDPPSFINSSFWEENSIPYYMKQKNSKKLKSLFKVIYHHVTFPPSSQLSNWMDAN